MQLVRRPLAAQETDYEFIWLLVSTGSFAFAAGWLALNLPWPICLFHEITGHPCATCGATRAAVAFVHGQFLTGWKWNPLAFVSYCAVVIFNLYALAVVIMRAPRLRLVRVAPTEKKFMRIGAVALLLANWIYLLIANRA
jgi:Protein of unknown function (DUF2752)